MCSNGHTPDGTELAYVPRSARSILVYSLNAAANLTLKSAGNARQKKHQSEYDGLTLAHALESVWAVPIRSYELVESDARLQLSLQYIDLINQ